LLAKLWRQTNAKPPPIVKMAPVRAVFFHFSGVIPSALCATAVFDCRFHLHLN
jgi:hypothetical protein